MRIYIPPFPPAMPGAVRTHKLLRPSLDLPLSTKNSRENKKGQYTHSLRILSFHESYVSVSAGHFPFPGGFRYIMYIGPSKSNLYMLATSCYASMKLSQLSKRFEIRWFPSETATLSALADPKEKK